MKQTLILSKKIEVSNDFNRDDCVADITRQLNDKAFKELINGEKHSLTLEYNIYVNEDDTEPKIDKEKAKALEIVERLKNIPDSVLKQLDIYELTMLTFDAYTLNH